MAQFFTFAYLNRLCRGVVSVWLALLSSANLAVSLVQLAGHGNAFSARRHVQRRRRLVHCGWRLFWRAGGRAQHFYKRKLEKFLDVLHAQRLHAA